MASPGPHTYIITWWDSAHWVTGLPLWIYRGRPRACKILFSKPVWDQHFLPESPLWEEKILHMRANCVSETDISVTTEPHLALLSLGASVPQTTTRLLIYISEEAEFPDPSGYRVCNRQFCLLGDISQLHLEAPFPPWVGWECWGGDWHLVGRGQGAARHPAIPRTAHNKESPAPTRQDCWGRKTLL